MCPQTFLPDLRWFCPLWTHFDKILGQPWNPGTELPTLGGLLEPVVVKERQGQGCPSRMSSEGALPLQRATRGALSDPERLQTRPGADAWGPSPESIYGWHSDRAATGGGSRRRAQEEKKMCVSPNIPAWTEMVLSTLDPFMTNSGPVLEPGHRSAHLRWAPGACGSA